MVAESDIGKTCVRIPRPRRKYGEFIRLLGHKPQIYYAFHFDGNFAFLDRDELERVRPLVTKARVDFSKLCQCWS